MTARPNVPLDGGLTAGGVIEVLLAEYANLKDEQRGRINTRDNLLYATLAAYAGVLTVTFSAHRPACLLLTAPVALILGWTYAANDTMITEIGAYIRSDLGPRVAALTGAASPFGWETGHFADPVRRTRKAGQLAVDLLAFALPPVASAVTYWATTPRPGPLAATAGAETLAALLLAAWITWNAGLTRGAV